MNATLFLIGVDLAAAVILSLAIYYRVTVGATSSSPSSA